MDGSKSKGCAQFCFQNERVTTIKAFITLKVLSRAPQTYQEYSRQKNILSIDELVGRNCLL